MVTQLSAFFMDFSHASKNSTVQYISYRVYDETKPKGYNIVTGKLSFEVNKILNPYEIAPTLVATDMVKIVVVAPE